MISLTPLSTSAKLKQPLLFISMLRQQFLLFQISVGVSSIGSFNFISYQDISQIKLISYQYQFGDNKSLQYQTTLLKIQFHQFQCSYIYCQINKFQVQLCNSKKFKSKSDSLQCLQSMSQFKPKTIAARLSVNISIIVSVFENPELMEDVCGPFTLPILHKSHLILVICIMQFIRTIYEPVVSTLKSWGILKRGKYGVFQFLTVKYLIILLIKIWLIFDEQHRKKFYLHTFLLEGTILFFSILFDCFNKDNIKQVGELLVIEGFHRLALVYVLTQTFCPNLILYYSITNILAQQRYGLNKSLYVKHDIYRFLFLSLAFFAITSITQLSSYGLKMLIVFLVTLKFYVSSLQNYNQNKFSKASTQLLLIALIFGGMEVAFALL